MLKQLLFVATVLLLTGVAAQPTPNEHTSYIYNSFKKRNPLNGRTLMIIPVFDIYV